MQLPRTVAEFKHYTDSYLAERDLGWERVVLNLDALDDSLFPSGKPVVEARFRRGLQWLTDCQQDPAVQGHFTAYAKYEYEADSNSKQQWSSPSTGL